MQPSAHRVKVRIRSRPPVRGVSPSASFRPVAGERPKPAKAAIGAAHSNRQKSLVAPSPATSHAAAHTPTDLFGPSTSRGNASAFPLKRGLWMNADIDRGAGKVFCRPPNSPLDDEVRQHIPFRRDSEARLKAATGASVSALGFSVCRLEPPAAVVAPAAVGEFGAAQSWCNPDCQACRMHSLAPTDAIMSMSRGCANLPG